ncbi:PIN domain-containing protein [Corynebacterium mastitidis]|uniref:PIN domain-containing protein n=1 Tax=Corynebacterium mastitidis TaxID=161890 RepID=A0ABU8P399_9CORY
MTSLHAGSVLADSNIWVSATLHSWFALIASETTGSWSFYWTEDIMAEAVKGRRRRFPKSSSKQMEDLRDRLLTIFGENKITGFPYDTSVSYPDAFDAHVHSAAVHAGIGIVVTENIKDFEALYENSDDRPYDLLRADEWLMLAAKSAPMEIDAVIRQQYSYQARIKDTFNLPAQLHQAHCPQFADYVRSRLQTLF